jgi:hypothetical protein
MSPLAIKIAMDLRRHMGNRGVPPNDPKDLPPRQDNVDNNLDANYKQENLIDPGIKNMVTGSGRGPVIGGYNRTRATEGSW